MKYNIDCLILPTMVFSIFGLIIFLKQNKRVDTLENDINIVLKTHLKYMEDRDLQKDSIKDLYDMMEGIAITLPFSNKHEWQNRMIQRKFNRELERYTVEEERKKMEDEERMQRVNEIQREERRRLKTQAQIKRVLDNEDIPQHNFYDDE